MVGLVCLACENSEAGWAWCARIVKGPGSNLEVVVESRKRLKRLRAFERRAVTGCQGLLRVVGPILNGCCRKIQRP